jgi:hypothetical protein
VNGVRTDASRSAKRAISRFEARAPSTAVVGIVSDREGIVTISEHLWGDVCNAARAH